MTQRKYTDQELVAMPRVNVDLLDQTLDYIIEHQETWDQGAWAMQTDCGTTLCFGGQVCSLAGEKIAVREDGELTLNGNTSGWYETAKNHLGLNSVEAQALFYDTIFVPNCDDMTDEEFKAGQLKNVKVEVEKIRARAKAQEAAFNRIAQEFIDAAGLDDVVQPGYKCPESEAIVQGIKGGANE